MRIVIAILALACALMAGIYIGAYPQTPVVGALKDVVAPDRATIPEDQVQTLIENDYYRAVSEQRLTDGSIGGMVKALRDPFSHYFNPEQNKQFETAISGSYGGVGMAVLEHRRGLLISHIYPRTPAAQAGLTVDDVITKIEGRSIAGESADVAVAKIKGPAGTKVSITVAKPINKRGTKLGPERSYELTRKLIDLPVADGRIVKRGNRRIGVIRLASFTETAGRLVRTQVQRLKRRGAGSYVLDLRGNGGGRLDQAVAVSSIFLNDGMIVATDGRSVSRTVYGAIKSQFVTAAPLVVVVNRGSASASEITAGALKYRDRALVVGTRTFGKGVFQEVTELKNGGAVSLTVGRYELPGRHYITKAGLKPDLEANGDRTTRSDETLDAALAALAKFKNAPGR